MTVKVENVGWAKAAPPLRMRRNADPPCPPWALWWAQRVGVEQNNDAWVAFAHPTSRRVEASHA